MSDVPAIDSSCARMSAAARWTARPAIVVDRLAPVERSYGLNRVSAPRTVTWSGSTPISSAAI
jgi:hypothetical protein